MTTSKTPVTKRQILINRLLSACEQGEISEATALLDQGVDINGQGSLTAQRPLISAAIGGDAGVSKLLVSRGADVDALVESKHLVEYQDCSALMVACRHGHLDCARILVEAGADVNLRSERDDNNHPLAQAARGGHLEVVKLLLKAGARVTAYALRHAVKNHPEMLDLFLENGGIQHVRNDRVSLYARLAIGNRSVRRGDVLKRQISVLKKLISIGANVSGRDDDPANGGCTPLVWALATESPELAMLLINAGAEVNTQELWHGCSALHHAAKFGYKDVVTALLSAGAEAGARNFAGKTPRELAESAGHRRIVTMLKKWESPK